MSFAKALEPWFAEIVAWHGLSGRCAAIRMLDERRSPLIDDVADEKEQLLVDLANKTVADDGADVVILAGAPLAGLANKIRDRVPVPLVDGIQAAVDDGRGAGAPESAQGDGRHLSPAGGRRTPRAFRRRWPT